MISALKLAVPVETSKQAITYVGLENLVPGMTIPEIIPFSGLFGVNLLRTTVPELVNAHIATRKVEGKTPSCTSADCKRA
jgi:hypothetical protein